MYWKRIVALIISLVSIQVHPIDAEGEDSTMDFLKAKWDFLHEGFVEK